MPFPFDHDGADRSDICSNTNDNAASSDIGSNNIGDRKFVHNPGSEELFNIEGTPRRDSDDSTGSSCNSSYRLLSLCSPQFCNIQLFDPL